MDFEHIFDSSYSRVLAVTYNKQGFFETFYQRFVVADEKVSELFKNTDMARQQKLLESSVYFLRDFYTTSYADDVLQKIAILHSKRVLDIPPALYDLWLEVLLSTVSDFDPLFDENIELAWRLVLSAGITFMKFKHNH
ncbi:globin [Motiliproteus sp. MSK22-1]|uniref:globin n=1 Tax=Motiliproteus sp. MSK22-1 TaxID=1897630 RepID=UPI000976E7BF|nr:globin [Motiliproteus sp. MSK22-1]OMH30802.1 globin [Motiliproteus sp. MSK22-1]